MKVLLTGAEGFIGSHLARHLNRAGVEVLSYGGDILDQASLSQFISQHRDAQSFINLAAISSVQEADKDFKRLIDVNVTGPTLILEELRCLNAQMHFIFPSTAQVYKVRASDGRIDESAELGPQNSYALSKVLAENVLQSYQEFFGGRFTILRIFNHSHKNQAPVAFLPSVYQQCFKAKQNGQKRVELKVGNLDVIRDFSPLQSLLSVFEFFVRENPSGSFIRTFNVASGKGFNLKELATELAHSMGLELSFTVEAERLRNVDIPYLVGDNSSLMRHMGVPASPHSLQVFIDAFLSEID